MTKNQIVCKNEKIADQLINLVNEILGLKAKIKELENNNVKLSRQQVKEYWNLQSAITYIHLSVENIEKANRMMLTKK